MNTTTRISLISGCIAALLAACDSHGAEPANETSRIELDATLVTGNEELPKVLYVVPWQAPGSRPELPATPDLDDGDLFRPLRPAAHRRELFYLNHLSGNGPKE
jgi:hypothetical protein